MTDTPTTVEGFAAGLSDKHLACRELGHHWRPLAVTWDSEAQAYDRQLRCPSCRTVRVQLITGSGHVLANHYRYPEGYLAKGVTVGQIGRDTFRLESVTRFLGKETPSLKAVV